MCISLGLGLVGHSRLRLRLRLQQIPLLLFVRGLLLLLICGLLLLLERSLLLLLERSPLLLLERCLLLRLRLSRVTLRRPVLVHVLHVGFVTHAWVWLIVHLLGLLLVLLGLFDRGDKGMVVVGLFNRGLVNERLADGGPFNGHILNDRGLLDKRLLGRTLVGGRELMLMLHLWHVDLVVCVIRERDFFNRWRHDSRKRKDTRVRLQSGRGRRRED